jgi:hypothetical protein
VPQTYSPKQVVLPHTNHEPRLLATLVIGVVLIWTIGALTIYFSLSTWQDRGQLGDLFGAINSLFSGLALAGVIYTLHMQQKGIELLRLQIQVEHEAQRRYRAIDDIQQFAATLDKKHPSARKVVDEFTVEECNKLVERTPFSIPAKHLGPLKYALADVLQDKELVVDKDRVLLESHHLTHLLGLIIDHLNKIEVALQGWFNGVSDSQIIEAQFRYMISIREDRYILEKFRSHSLVEHSYPAIAAFVARIKSQAAGGTAITRGAVV